MIQGEGSGTSSRVRVQGFMVEGGPPAVIFFRQYIPFYEYLIIISKKGGNKIFIGLFKKVVWAFPERNGKIHWVAARIPVVTVQFRFIGWLVGAWLGGW